MAETATRPDAQSRSRIPRVAREAAQGRALQAQPSHRNRRDCRHRHLRRHMVCAWQRPRKTQTADQSLQHEPQNHAGPACIASVELWQSQAGLATARRSRPARRCPRKESGRCAHGCELQTQSGRRCGPRRTDAAGTGSATGQRSGRVVSNRQ